jgi:metallo-beta-lactamase family protein
MGRYNTPIIRDPQALPGPVDYVITESTYGSRAHGAMNEVGPTLLEAVRYCINRKSRLVIPAFAVGRTQIILWYIQRFIQEGLIREIPIYVDSPMGIEVSEVHSQFRDYLDDETREAIGKKDLFGTSRVTFTRTMQESMRINADSGPCVIIASSPTCEFGRILHHLKRSVERPNDLVVIVGWTPPHTLGRRLQDGDKRVKIYDRWYDVQCQIQTLHGISAHADADELIQFLHPTIRPETSFYVVHGEPDSSAALAERLISAGAARAMIPSMETEAILQG